jgi:hypothetical protein
MLPAMLRLCYLGQRNYLHGTTLFDALRGHCRDGVDITFRIARLMETDRVMLEHCEPGKDGAGRYSATLGWNEGSSGKSIGVIPLPPSGNPARGAFDEGAITDRARLEGSLVSTADLGGESLARNIVALNKALLFSLLKPAAPGQWLFVRLDLQRDVETASELRIAYRASVGLAAVSSTIEIDGEAMGSVVFSWWKK